MATEILRPNAAGDETGISSQYPASGAHWEQVDEEVADDNSTYIYESSTSYKRDLYNLPAHSEGSGTINSITIYFRCRRSPGAGVSYAKPSLKSDGTITDGTEVSLSSTIWGDFSQTWTTNPADSAAWEWADIDALQIGVSLKKGAVSAYCTQVYVEVDYTLTATGKSSADTGTGTEGAPSSTATPTGSESGQGQEIANIQLTDKTSADSGAGTEDTPVPDATLAISESGQGQEAASTEFTDKTSADSGQGQEASSSSQPIAKTAADSGAGAELEGLLKELFAGEPGKGSDSFSAKIEAPTKGGGMKLWI